LARLRAPGVQIVSLLGILAGLLAPAGCGGGKPQLPPPGHVQVPWIEVESAGGPWNVLLLTLDTVRADRFGCYGSRAGLTPRLDEAARRGVLFENAVAPTPITLPSHATMLTGLDPQAHGVRNNGTFVLDPKHVTLAELLKGEGYATGAVIGQSRWRATTVSTRASTAMTTSCRRPRAITTSSSGERPRSPT